MVSPRRESLLKMERSEAAAVERSFSEMDLREQLRCATVTLSCRGLKNSSKWCAEQLAGIDMSSAAAAAPVGLAEETARLLKLEMGDCSDAYLLAKTYFDVGEFQRCAFALQPSDGGAMFAGLRGEEVRDTSPTIL